MGYLFAQYIPAVAMDVIGVNLMALPPGTVRIVSSFTDQRSSSSQDATRSVQKAVSSVCPRGLYCAPHCVLNLSL